jgi:hypothetical protein
MSMNGSPKGVSQMNHCDQVNDPLVRTRLDELRTRLAAAQAAKGSRPSDVVSARAHILVEVMGWQFIADCEKPPRLMIIDELTNPWSSIREQARTAALAFQDVLDGK